MLRPCFGTLALALALTPAGCKDANEAATGETGPADSSNADASDGGEGGNGGDDSGAAGDAADDEQGGGAGADAEGGAGGDRSCEDGTEGCPCYGNDTCNEALRCEAGRCVACEDGTEGCPCYGNDTCDSGLSCSNDGVCVGEGTAEGGAGPGSGGAATAGVGASDGGAASGGTGAGGTAASGGTGGGGTAGTGGTGPTGTCLPGEIMAAEGLCVLAGTVDDFGSCDRQIYEVEGRIGSWYFYRGLDVGCDPGACEGVSAPPWGSACGAWTAGGYDPLVLPLDPDLYGGMGVTLNDSGMFFDACGATDVEVEYASDQPVELFAKWDDVDIYGERDSVVLPATSGVSTATVSLTSFSGIDCATLTEFQFEPTSLSGYGIAVYSLRFVGAGSAACAEGDTRCNGSGLEMCQDGHWAAGSCSSDAVCRGDRCVPATATPVDVHGHLSVSGTRVVDERGYPVQLKGISSQWLNYESDGYATNPDAMIWMRDHWGISVFRAAMGADEDHDGSYVESAAAAAEMTAQVDTIVQNAIDAGIYVIVDWHSHHTTVDEASAFFAGIATRWGAYPNVLIETYNEPLDVSWASTLKPYHTAVVAAFRAADPDDDTHPNIAILGTPNWDQDVDVAAASPVTGVNLLYTSHFYSCTHGALERSKAMTALNAGLPLFVTEWGATDANGGVYPDTDVCTAEADAWHDWMDANGIGWAAWKLDDCDGQEVADATCLLALDAPVDGGWTAADLNGHASYVLSKL